MRIIIALCAALFLVGCSQRTNIPRQLQAEEVRFKDHIGFIVYDPVQRKTLIEYNSSKYFTPASNTKVFTLYTSLQLLRDSLPGLKYNVFGDSLYFRGTGDPTLFYSAIHGGNDRVFNFLHSAPQSLVFSVANFNSDHFGPGWAWDDYMDYYSAEKSPLPVHGNLATLSKKDGRWDIYPRFFGQNLVRGDSASKTTAISRDLHINKFVIHPGKSDGFKSTRIPFHTHPDIVAGLLADTLRKPIRWSMQPLKGDVRTLFSVPADSVYKVMMQDSDNFIAEQLLLMCSDAVSDTLKTEIAIKYALKKYLFDLPDTPIWVDGSGLSRYNLFTPRTMVRLWDKIYTKVPKDRLFKLLAAGGQSGTLKNSYKAEKPYIYGKTGSLSNNHSLSGFLITKADSILIFSFMNSNFVDANADVRNMMEKILLEIRDKY